jgi:diguanylate cyclase (GGDEF)-like protein
MSREKTRAWLRAGVEYTRVRGKVEECARAADEPHVRQNSSRRSGARLLVSYGATSLLAFALIAIDPGTSRGELLVAALLTSTIPALVAVLPWRSLPRAARLVPIALFFVAAFLLRDSAGGQTSGVGVVALLPICWLALHGTRTELSIGLAGVAAFWVLPVLLIGGEAYPLSQLRIAVTYVAVATMIGLTVHSLVRALAANVHNVARLAAAARSVLTADDARTEICRAACDVSDATFAFLFEPAGTSGLQTTAMAGIAVEPQTIDSGTGRSATLVAFSEQRTVLVADASTHPAINPAMWAAHGRPSSMLFEPVRRGDETIGVLVVGWAHHVANLRTGGPALIGLLAAEAATAIAHTDLVHRLGELADTDPLTGLPNRRTWDRELDRALHSTPPTSVCVAMLDLDHFKAFNDTHGHLAGDRQLKSSAIHWQAQLRSSDIVARIGGEEFAVLLPGCSIQDAATIVERLRQATPGDATCSAGLVDRATDETSESLMARADAALYAAKDNGRDQILTIARP